MEGLNTHVVGVSVDHVPVLKAWAESLDGITFPLLSDFWPHGAAAREWGVFREVDGHSERAIFIVDAKGIVRYVDVHDIADQPDNEVLFAELAKLEPAASKKAPAAVPETTPPSEHGLIMYCRSWCPDCRRARAWLDEQGLEYVEVDVESVPGARELAASLNDGALHTPTFVYGEGVCIDFRPERIKEMLDMR